MKINVEFKWTPSTFYYTSQQEMALREAEEQMKQRIFEALEPYIKREISEGHVRLTLDGIESEDLGFENYQMEYHKTLKFVEPNGQRND